VREKWGFRGRDRKAWEKKFFVGQRTFFCVAEWSLSSFRQLGKHGSTRNQGGFRLGRKRFAPFFSSPSNVEAKHRFRGGGGVEQVQAGADD
jgi:hypothetical protein